MKSQKATKIVFEAFGQQHIVFSESQDSNYLQTEIKKICPSVYISQVSETMVSKDTFLLNNFENIIRWNEKIKEMFK